MLKEVENEGFVCNGVQRVLILILMEHAQREHFYENVILPSRCLNPYFNGTCSKSFDMVEVQRIVHYVLILILMEHAQREHFL